MATMVMMMMMAMTTMMAMMREVFGPGSRVGCSELDSSGSAAASELPL